MSLREDLKRYPKRAFLREQSIWAIAVYRFGRWGDRRRTRLGRALCNLLYAPVHRVVETLTGISIPKTVVVGPGLRIWHFGNIIVNADAVIGANCTLRHGVTIGNREEGGASPVIEDDVDLGAYAQVLGPIRVGRGARIGAMSVVLCDVPPGHTAVGIPARIIPPKNTPETPENNGAARPGPGALTASRRPSEEIEAARSAGEPS